MLVDVSRFVDGSGGDDAEAFGVIEKNGQKSEMVRVGTEPTRKSDLKRTKKYTTSWTYQGDKVTNDKRSLPYIIFLLKISIAF